MFVVVLVTAELAAQPSVRSDTVSLNGLWQSSSGDGSEQAWLHSVQNNMTWGTTTVPGNNLDTTGANINNIEFAWARRDFTLSSQQAQRMAILFWDYVTLGASVYINGQFVGHNEPTGPFQVIIAPGVLQGGTNQIVMKVAGYAGVDRSASGYPLIPTGQLIAWGGQKEPAIREDIWIDFADTAYMKWILAIPDVTNGKVTIRVTPDALNTVNSLSLDVTVREWPGGAFINQASRTIGDLVPDSDPLGGTHSYLDVPMPGFEMWSHVTPDNLYSAEVQLRQGSQVLDSATIRFGMREVDNVNGDYWMNGNRLWLRGTSTSNPNWAKPSVQEINDKIYNDYKAANINTVRFHLLPPPKIFADAYDEAGLMMMPEFPVTYNYHDFKFTSREYDTFRQNCLRDAAGWVTRLWNHPGVIIWILSNESRVDNDWERGPFRDFVQNLDPTRPAMLAGATGGGADGTPDNYDVHSLGPALPEGREITGAASWQNAAGPSIRTCTNTEYMNYANRDWIWTGDDNPANKNRSVLQLGSELTEGMRRNSLDCILWYGSFGSVDAPYSFMSPVLASLDLFDPSYTTGTWVTTDMYLINDSWSSTDLHVDLLLTSSDPKFVYNSPAFSNPVARWSYNYTVAADTTTVVPITWQTPQAGGNYWLTARATGSGITGNPVLSQRFLHIVEPAQISSTLRQKNFVILGSDSRAAAFFSSKGLTMSSSTSNLNPSEDMVIIWNPASLTAAEKQSASALCNFAGAGGHVVVLSASSWNWSALCSVQIGNRSSSRAFPYGGTQHPMFDGIQPEFFSRWNSVGRRGLVADNDLNNLTGANEILWIYQPGDTVVAEVPAATGNGLVLFSQLDIRDRLDNAKAEYDPVAERVFINVLNMLDQGQSSNRRPTAEAGNNQTVTDGDGNGSEQVRLYGSGSSDPDGTIVSYVWSEGGSTIATGMSPNVTLSVGDHPITLTVTDNDGATDTDTVMITVNPPSVIQYTIQASASSGGSITPSGNVSVNSGANKSFSIAASTGYSISNVSVDGVSRGAISSYTFYNVSSDHTITASFSAKTYSLTVNSTNGYVTKSPNLANYNHGTTVALEAFANAGYSFSHWSGALSGRSNPADVYMNSNKTVRANFVIDSTPPATFGHIPGRNSIQAARDTVIQLHIADSGSGVEIDTVRIQVEGKVVYDGRSAGLSGSYDSILGICRRVGSASDYTFIFQPSAFFDYEQKVDVTINAGDKAGNSMQEERYYFYTTMRMFGKNVKVNSDVDALEQDNPATATDSSGNVWVVWDQRNAGGDTDVYISKLSAGAGSFDSSQLVFGGPNEQRNPAMAIDSSDKIYVVCEGYSSSGGWDLFVSTSANGKDWLSGKVNVDDTGNVSDQTSPAIAIDGDDKKYITWEDNRAGNRDIWAATSTNGIDWNLQSVAAAASNQSEPAIAVEGNNRVHIVWTDARSSQTGEDIYSAESGTWSNSPVVNTNGNQSRATCAVSSDGDLHLLWVDENGYDDIVYGNDGNGWPFVGISIVDEDNTNQVSPSIAIDGMKVFACWEDWRHAANNADADIYFSESSLRFTDSHDRTNILVNDDMGTYSQTSPVIGTDRNGNPYMVWVDNREGNNDIYYAAAMSSQPLKASLVDAGKGGTVKDDDSALQIEIPAGALPADTQITIAEMVSAPELPADIVGVPYEFSPSGLQFSSPVTITVPHTSSECPGYSAYGVYWYNAQTGSWSRDGISNVRHVQISSTEHAVRFQTTHFTSFGIGASVDTGVVGGGGGGGCAVSADNEGSVAEYVLPYLFCIAILLIIRRKDANTRKMV
jgi:hypothetical protein